MKLVILLQKFGRFCVPIAFFKNLGLEHLPVVDPPWMPKLKTKVENLDIRRRGQVWNNNQVKVISLRNEFMLRFFLREIQKFCKKNLGPGTTPPLPEIHDQITAKI